VGNIFVLLFV